MCVLGHKILSKRCKLKEKMMRILTEENNIKDAEKAEINVA